jgi:rhodanese-related sulfurtransferase
VSAAELARDWPDRTAVRVVDVRTPAEFESAHLPGSYNVPLDRLPVYGAALAAGTAPYVLVCRMGNRAREAETLLRGAGCEAVQVLEGGLEAWERAGLPVERGRQRWSIERQVRGVAGSLVLAGALGGLFVARPMGVLAAFVGGGLVFSALTDFCGMAKLLAMLPYNQEASTEVEATVAALTTPAGRGVSE